MAKQLSDAQFDAIMDLALRHCEVVDGTAVLPVHRLIVILANVGAKEDAYAD